jgi:hypothetical protein
LAKTSRSIGVVASEVSPRNFQIAGLASGVLRASAMLMAGEGQDVRLTLSAANIADGVGAWLMGRAATSQVQLARQAAQTAAGGSASRGVSGLEQLAAMSRHVVSVQPLLRGLQVVGSFGGVFAGVFQIAGGVAMRRNDDRYDNGLADVQVAGGVATLAGSAITLGAAMAGPTAVAAAPIGVAVAVGAAPVLLGAGAIAAAGVLAYDYLKDKPVTAAANQRLEATANRAGGFSDTSIDVGRTLASRGVPTGLAVAAGIGAGIVQNAALTIGDAINFIGGLFTGQDSGG